ncbi:polysaccharide pyruvyl transferase CsaB [bacterium]|nr:MAG: polysaccharide pyruvyl transferase CsaB [bacterium]
MALDRRRGRALAAPPPLAALAPRAWRGRRPGRRGRHLFASAHRALGGRAAYRQRSGGGRGDRGRGGVDLPPLRHGRAGGQVRVLLSGYYGFGNLGDEALLAEIARGLRRRFPGVEIVALSADPPATARAYGIEAAPRWDVGAVRRELTRADVFLSGGGGLLQNSTSLKSLLYYAGLVRQAVHARKVVGIFAQSIGPLDFWGKGIVREFCKGVTFATVRDDASRALLASLLPGVPVERTADPVFLYEPPERGVEDALVREGLGAAAQPLVIVSVRKTAAQREVGARVASAVDALAEQGAHVAFLPFQSPEDAEAATDIIRKCRSAPTLLPGGDLDAVARAIASAQAVIGVRLHALVLAARFAVPFAAVSYDPKVGALLSLLDYPLPALWEPGARKGDGEFSARVATQLWSERVQLAAQLRERLPELQRAARANFEILSRYV